MTEKSPQVKMQEARIPDPLLPAADGGDMSRSPAFLYSEYFRYSGIRMCTIPITPDNLKKPSKPDKATVMVPKSR